MIVRYDVGEVGVAAVELEDDSFGPSEVTLLTGASSDFAADLVPAMLWCLIDATTSSAVTVFPLWKVTPFLTLKTHFLAPSDGSKLSARSGTASPLASTSVRLLDSVPQQAVPVYWS